jgi:hypothetical protein
MSDRRCGRERPVAAILDPAVEGVDHLVEAAGLQTPRGIRRQKTEAGDRSRRQKTEGRSASRRGRDRDKPKGNSTILTIVSRPFCLLSSDF